MIQIHIFYESIRPTLTLLYSTDIFIRSLKQKKNAVCTEQLPTMVNNTTETPSNYFLRLCSFDGDAVITSAFNSVTVSISIVIALLSPIAVAGNSLILAAIWKSPSLRAPRYILFGGLAFADLCTGLVSQPFCAAAEFICLEEPRKIEDKLTFLVFAKLIVASFSTYFLGVTVLLHP